MPGISVDETSLKALYQGMKLVFNESYKANAFGDAVSNLCLVVPSKTDSEAYPFLGSLPAVREFLGTRQINQLVQHDYSLKNKTWENTIGVQRAEIEDNKLGIIRVRVKGLAEMYPAHRNKMVADLINNNGTCYDGKNYFATDHPVDENGNTQSNLLATALTPANLAAAITAVMKFKDSEGQSLNLSPDTFVCGPDLQWTAMEILESDYFPGVTTQAAPQKLAKNVMKGRLKLVVLMDLTDTTAWGVFDTSKALKPFIWQDRISPELMAQESLSDAGFMRDEFIYGTRARYNAGYGMWQMGLWSSGGD